jgi:hypothetical protein
MEEELIIKALGKALAWRKPAPGLIVHSDRGGQYVGNQFRKLLDQHDYLQSMSRADDAYDNAFAESFFSRFKTELLQDGTFMNLEDARTEIFEFIEMYYNSIQDQGAGTAVVNAPGTYTVTARGANGCSNTASAIVSEDKAAPTPSITASATTLSAGQSVTLSAGGATSYAWSTGETGPTITLVPPTGTTVYSLTATSTNGCSATASISIVVSNTPPATVVRGPARLCVKSSPPAKGMVTLPLTMTVVGGSASYSYRWSYKAPSSVNYKFIAPAGTSIGKASFVPLAVVPSLSLTGTRGNLNGLQGYLIQLTVLQGNQVVGRAQTLLDGSCPLRVPGARVGLPEEASAKEGMQVQLYPNPVRDLLQVELRGLSGPVKVILYDLKGQLHNDWTVEPVRGAVRLQADVSALSQGVYLLQVEAPEGVLHRQKVLKLR